MKKLLALMLVLCLASVASATISMDVSGTVDIVIGNTLTVTVSSSDSNPWNGYIIIQEGGDGALSNGVVLDTGNLSDTQPYSEDDWGIGYSMVAGTTDVINFPVVVGDQFSYDYDTTGMNYGDTAILSLWDDGVGYEPDQDEQGIALLNVIPEPMTIALLGLGGLLLRRRK
jgi:hypothetical protein